jgi:hypothetical protein
MSLEHPDFLEKAGDIVEDHIIRTIRQRREQFTRMKRKRQHSLQIVDQARVEGSQGRWEDALLFFQACDGANNPED